MEDELLELAEEPVGHKNTRGRKIDECEPCEPHGSTPKAPATTFDYMQWSAEPNGQFRASGPKVSSLPPGVYVLGYDNRGLYFEQQKIITDDLIELDDAPSVKVLESIRKFWKSRERYTKRGYIYKRGILMYGPAGAGKTGLLMLLTKELIANGGIVLMNDKPQFANEALQSLRRIEPDRPLINVLEDIDELISEHGEHSILAMLDGENQISNVVNLATTNYPERLGGRICNRPSRFDERIKIDMPNELARMRYLSYVTRNEPEMTTSMLKRWVVDTNKFGIAHMRELAVAVFCLEQPYDEVLERLRLMATKPKEDKEFGGRDGLGFTPERD